MRVLREIISLLVPLAIVTAVVVGGVQLLITGSDWVVMIVIQVAVLAVAAVALVATASWRGHRKAHMPERTWLDWFRHL